ncbi:MAG: hypothetical protein IT583_06210 [Verrucomicrobia bacterium]|nr:hypothetical protein [Verrucomicrobiota bacterium]
MKPRSVYIVLSLAFGLLTGCGASTETLAKEVRASVEETFAKNPDLKDAQIKTFMLVHKGGKQYAGVLEGEINGEPLNLSIDVTYDGKAFMWKIVE